MRPLRPYEDLLSNNPLLRIVLPLAAGIALADWFYVSHPHLLFALAAATLACVLALCFVRSRWGFLVLLNVTMSLVGAVLLTVERQQLEVVWEEDAQTFRAVVTDEPRMKPRSQQVFAQIVGGAHDGQQVRLTLLPTITDSVMPTQTPLRAGDVVLCRGVIESPRNTGNPAEFDYAQWLRRQQVTGTAVCFSGNWRLARETGDLPFSLRALRWRSLLVDRMEAHMQGRELAIFSAITLGDDSRIDAATRQVYSRTGVSHVIALSGMHLSILFMFFNFVILRRCRRRWLYVAMSCVGIVGLWGYAFLSGMPLSLLRAALMFSMVQGVLCFRHDVFSINNLALAAIVILFIWPQSLFDVGFQLSCLSVFFIVAFVPAFPVPKALREGCYMTIGEMLRSRRPLRLLGRSLLRSAYMLMVVSIVAQLGTSPLVAYYFHTFPVYGLLGNFVAVPLSYVLLGGGLAFFLLPFAQGLIAATMSAVLRWQDAVLSAMSSWSGAVLTFRPSAGSVFFLYIFVVLLVAWRLRRRMAYCYAAGVLLLAVGLYEGYAHRASRLSPQLVCYNLYGATAVHAIGTNQHSYLWTSGPRADSALDYVRRTFWQEEGMAEPVRLDSPMHRSDIEMVGHVLSFGGRRIALLNAPLPKASPERPLRVDYLLLARGYRGGLGRALSHYAPRCVVLDGSLTDYYHRTLLEESRKACLAVHDMRQDGALVDVLE